MEIQADNCNKMEIQEDNCDNILNEKEQEIRSELRTRFLWSCTALNGKEGKLELFEGITVDGTCRGMDKDIKLMHMQNLKTPYTTYPFATVRLTDCLQANFKMDK